MDRIEKTIVAALKQALDDDLSALIVPPGAALIFEWFMDLHIARSWHANGPNPISYQEINAYAQLGRWNLAPHHISLLRAMDATFIENFIARRERLLARDDAPQKPTGNLSPALFDAVFA